MIACFKYDRKSNYKRGATKVMGPFEDTKAFWEYYRVFWVLGSFVSEGLETRKEAADLQNEVTVSLKHQAQFEEDMAGTYPSFTNMVKFSHDLLVLCMVLQQVRKEDRPGPEVAKEVLEKVAPMIEKVKLSAQATQVNFEKNKDISEQILMMGSVLPMVIELLSESLKLSTPNMKKKKDPAFDELKANVIKPLKEVVNSFRLYFEKVAQYYAEQKEKDLFTEAELQMPDELIAYLKDQRLGQINKEYKSSMERFRDLAEKLGKRYQVMASQLKGFNL